MTISTASVREIPFWKLTRKEQAAVRWRLELKLPVEYQHIDEFTWRPVTPNMQMIRQRITEWHLEDVAEEMRMRLLGKKPRCNTCQYRTREKSEWCEHEPDQPRQFVAHNDETDLRSYCVRFKAAPPEEIDDNP